MKVDQKRDRVERRRLGKMHRGDTEGEGIMDG